MSRLRLAVALALVLTAPTVSSGQTPAADVASATAGSRRVVSNPSADGDLHGITLDAQAGVAIPLGNLRNATSTGGAFGLGVSFWLSPRVALRASGEFEPLSGAELPQAQFDSSSESDSSAFPGSSLWYYSGGIEGRLLEPTGTWSVNGTLAVGGSTLSIERRDGTHLTKTYVSSNAGLAVGRRVGQQWEVYLKPQVHVVFNSSDDFLLGGDNNLQPASPLWTLATTLGIRWSRG